MVMRGGLAEDLGRSVAFGAICGSLTGFSLGVVDTYYKLRREPQQPMSMATRLALDEMARSGTIVAAFFAAYQVAKCSLSRAGLEDQPTSVLISSTLSLAPLSLLPPLRRYIPFSATLIAVDAYHTHRRLQDDDNIA